MQAESITFTVVHPPRHGLIERSSSGQRYHPTTTFTMEDIYQSRISYSHDGSNSLKDRFAFTVSDGTNPFFVVEDGGKKVSGQRERRERPLNQVVEGCLLSEEGDLAAVTPLKIGAQYSWLCDAMCLVRGVMANFMPANLPQDLDPNRSDGSKADNTCMVAKALTPKVTSISLTFSQVVTAAPQRFKVDILPVDDGTPRVVTNLGLQWLEYMDGKVTGCLGLD